MKRFGMVLGLLSVVSASAWAQDASKVDSGDTAWVLISAALVMLMTPGLALFYEGMVRRKNVLGTIMQSFIALGVVTIQWVLIGYSLAFGPDVGGFVGSLAWAGLAGVGVQPNPDYAATIPHQAYMIFQMMFAIITPALITGAFAERFKFKTYLIFLLLWTTFVYCPIAHWVWGVGGWIRSLGALDFAGGLVVHLSSGAAALAAALVVGKRRGYGNEIMPPHNLTMTLLGAALLWFGWFGFNGGSAVASGALATTAFVTTHIATAGAAFGWLAVEWYKSGKPTVLGAASGAVAGLVAITPASGFVSPLAALLIGVVGGALCYLAVSAKPRLGYDDSLDGGNVGSNCDRVVCVGCGQRRRRRRIVLRQLRSSQSPAYQHRRRVHLFVCPDPRASQGSGQGLRASCEPRAGIRRTGSESARGKRVRVVGNWGETPEKRSEPEESAGGKTPEEQGEAIECFGSQWSVSVFWSSSKYFLISS